MRWSLLDLFGLILFAAILSDGASVAGLDSPVLWISYFWMGAVTTIYIAMVAGQERHRFAVMLVALGLNIFACFNVFASLASIVCTLLLSFVTGLAAIRNKPCLRRTKIGLGLGCMAIAVMSGTLIGRINHQNLLTLRHKYPIVDISPRLARISNTVPNEFQPSNLSQPVMNTLAQFDKQFAGSFDYGTREYYLQQLHSQFYDSFERSLGFGAYRMARIRPEYIEAPPLTDIAFSEKMTERKGSFIYRLETLPFANGNLTSVSDIHSTSIVDFLPPWSFGASVNKSKQVIGFQEHGFRQAPLTTYQNREAWDVVRLELVSLLRYDQPKVYVLDHLPRMDQLTSDQIPTRDLDEFEFAALQRLWNDSDVEIRPDAGNYRMLGSLRAANTCQQCHEVEKGQLLGAFSYVIRHLDLDSNDAP